MGHECRAQIFLMISVIIFLLLFLQNTHILISTDSFSSAEGKSAIDGFKKFESVEVKARAVGKVSGSFVVEKFRLLLGMKSFYRRKPFGGNTDFLAPSPSPSPAPAPAPVPAPVPHLHSWPRKQNHRSFGPPKESWHHKSHGSTSKTLVAAVVPAGVISLACIIGLFWACWKFVKSRGVTSKRNPVYRKRPKGGKGVKSISEYGGSRSSATNKVSFNPGIDLLYLESLGVDIEKQEICASDRDLHHPKLGKSLPGQEGAKPEFDDGSISSTREIMLVHNDTEPDLYHSSRGLSSSSGDRIILIENENHSSEEESFHSFGDLHDRLSNASGDSISENPGTFRENESSMASSLSNPSKACPYTAACRASENPSNTKLSDGKVGCPSAYPLPPPPPPPPPHPPRSSSLPSISSKQSVQKSLPFSRNESIPSSTDSNSSPHSNQTPKVASEFPLRTGIPPPPSPPPFRNVIRASLKNPGPPPPPSQFPDSPPLNKDGSPLPKLKPLHWDKVRAAPDRSMVWDKLRSSSFELDEEMIESLFGYNLQNPMKNEDRKSRTPSPNKHVLDPKRLQNINILSKALNVGPDQVCDALLRGNGLSQQQLEALVKMVPIKEEEAKLLGFEGDASELGPAERFMKALLGIPSASQRIEAMLYRETFEDEILHLSNSFSMLEEACKELRSSRLFLKLLEAVLKTGNRMNVGTIRGGAKAFKLDALLKLADIKGTDGKTTLLHFVVQEIIRSEGIRVSDSIMGKIAQRNRIRSPEEKEEDYKRMGLDLVTGLSTELYNVKKTATIDLDVLASSVSNLSQGLSKLWDLLSKDAAESDEKRKEFVQSMRVFLGHAEKSLSKLKEDEDRVLLQVREITEYFHGKVSKDEKNPLRIFVIVRDFMGMLDHVCKELRSSKVPSSPSPLAPFK